MRMSCAGPCRSSDSCLTASRLQCSHGSLKVSPECINSFSLSLVHVSPMSQTEHRALNVTDDKANLQGNITLLLIAHPTQFHHLCLDPALNPAQMTSLANKEPKSKFTDTLTPLFVMSCEMTDAYKKKAENWIASISSCAPHFYFPHFFTWTHQVNTTDELVLCSTYRITFSDGPRPQTRPTGYIRILPREYV